MILDVRLFDARLLDVWTPVVIPLLAAPAAGYLADRLRPRVAAWLLSVAIIGLAASSTATLALMVAAGLVHLPIIANLGHLSLPLIDRDSPIAIPDAVLAGVLLALGVDTVVRGVRQRHADLVRARSLVAGHPYAGDLAVLADERPDAYALPGRPPLIVVTVGMLRVLDAAEREVLLAHERSHLANRHYRFLSAAGIAAGLNPLLRWLPGPLAYSLERWADESAADVVGDRQLTARAIGRAALAAASPVASGRPRTVLAATAGPVPRRVAAMLDCDASGRVGRGKAGRIAIAPLIGLALSGCLLLSGACSLDTATDLGAQIEGAQVVSIRPVSHPLGFVYHASAPNHRDSTAA